MKKRNFLILSALILGAGLYMGSKSNDLSPSERAEYVVRAKHLISKINSRDFLGCHESFDNIMKETMSVDRMKKIFVPALDTLGDFVRYRNASASHRDSFSDYTLCQIRCEYTNGLAAYTFLFDKNFNVSNISIK